jgi:hypothetical protein
MRSTKPIRLNELNDAINWVPTVFTSSAHRKRVGERRNRVEGAFYVHILCSKLAISKSAYRQ